VIKNEIERVVDQLVEQRHGSTQRRPPPNVPLEGDDGTDIDRLREIQEEIAGLAEEAFKIVDRSENRGAAARAKAY
jgi:hypothetical protein